MQKGEHCWEAAVQVAKCISLMFLSKDSVFWLCFVFFVIYRGKKKKDNLATFWCWVNDDNVFQSECYYIFAFFFPFSQIGSCKNVTVMSLRSNKLEFLPDEIGQMQKLRVLNLSDNRYGSDHVPNSCCENMF